MLLAVFFVSASVCLGAGLTLRDAPIATATPLLYLDGPSWTASEASLGLSIAATVPGDVLTDLQRARVVGDPYYELTFVRNRTLWDVASRSWVYSTSITLPPPGSPAGATLLLVLEGVKMAARVSLNGVPLGNVSNQFVRYTFPLPPAAILLGAAANRLDVAFDSTIPTFGRFQASAGAWDWAPLSRNNINETAFGVMTTFSSGVVKSLYLAAVAPGGAAVSALVPLVRYLGAYPVGALVDGAHAGFSVNVTAHLWAPAGGARGSLTVAGGWAGAAATTAPLALPAGASAVALTLAAPAAAVRLWWPNGLGGQPLYNVSATWTPAGGAPGDAATAVRRIGFRVAALVTVNDTNATVVAQSAGADGSGTGFTMFFRVNGAPLYARGANLVPMENLEGRLDARAHATLVNSAADAGANMIRVWGGGVYPPDVLYDACDERGILLYHDLMFARGDLPAQLPTGAADSILAEVAHQIRRLSPHPALILYDSNNEDVVGPTGPSAAYSTLVMAAVAREDASRVVWPSSPSAGWRSGVDRLWGTPNGRPLVALGGGHAYYAGNEEHRFYTAGVGAWGWQTVIRDPWTQAHTFDPGLPLRGLAPGGATGVGAPGNFVTEFGSTSMSSFESMSGTLAPASWGLHGGGAPPACTPEAGSFYSNCTGGNAMAERNWACDNLVWSYFGPAQLNATGEFGFKAGLFLCAIASALNMQTVIEAHRGANFHGALVWQLNEIWPTGGWGVVEHGSAASPGSLPGGRWKPVLYWLKAHLFADVMSACGLVGRTREFVCYVNNARPDAGFAGTLELTVVDLASGRAAPWASLPAAVARGPNALAWLAPPNATLPDANTTVLLASLTDGATGRVLDEHLVPLTAPANLRVPRAAVSAAVAPAPHADGSVDVTVAAADAVALFVTLTAAAPGRFSDNAFTLLPGAPRALTWLPFAPGGDATANRALLAATLRVEDLSAYVEVVDSAEQ